jgi:hypothetical protein
MTLGVRKRTQEAIAMKLALTDRERRDLKRFMHRILDELQCDRNSYSVFNRRDPNFGRLIRGETDITDQTFRDERDALMFASRLG